MPSQKCTVRDFMSKNPVTLSPETDVMAAVQTLVDRNIPGAPVIDQVGNIVGFLAERDCLAAALNASYHQESSGPVTDFMQTEIHTVDADSSIADVARNLIETGLRGYPVVSEDRLVGQINRSDILRALTVLRD